MKINTRSSNQSRHNRVREASTWCVPTDLFVWSCRHVIPRGLEHRGICHTVIYLLPISMPPVLCATGKKEAHLSSSRLDQPLRPPPPALLSLSVTPHDPSTPLPPIANDGADRWDDPKCLWIMEYHSIGPGLALLPPTADTRVLPRYLRTLSGHERKTSHVRLALYKS